MNNLGVKKLKLETNRQNISLLAFLVFLISPIASLPFILFSVYCKERFGLFVLSLFGGIVSYSIIPSWDLDLSRYYLLYDEISKGGYSSFIDVVGRSNDYAFFFIYYIFSLVGFQFQFMLLILSTLLFYISFLVFDLIIKRFNPTRSNYFLLFICFLLSLPVLSLVSVTRFSMGYSFFMIFVYFRLINKNKISYLYLLLACVTHFSYLVFVPFIILFNFFKSKRKINIMLIIVGVSVLVLNASGGILNYAQYIPIISEKMVTYATIYQDTSIPILSLSLLIPVLISIIFFFAFSNYIPAKVMQVFLGILIVALITIPFNLIIYDRYIQVFKPIFVLTMVFTLLNYRLKIPKQNYLKFIILILNVPFILYYLYTFYVVYSNHLSTFFTLDKFLLVSILSSNYTYFDFY